MKVQQGTMFLALAASLAGCFGSTDGGSGGGAGQTGPAPAERCAPGSADLEACERAVTVGRHCCWDALGFSRTFDQWGAEGSVTGPELCRRIAANGRAPADSCAAFVALFPDDPAGEDVAGTCPAFDGFLASQGAVLGTPVCCCWRGQPCVRDAAGRYSCGATR